MKWVLVRRRKSGHQFVVHYSQPATRIFEHPTVLAAHILREGYTLDDAKTFVAYLNERGVQP